MNPVDEGIALACVKNKINTENIPVIRQAVLENSKQMAEAYQKFSN